MWKNIALFVLLKQNGCPSFLNGKTHLTEETTEESAIKFWAFMTGLMQELRDLYTNAVLLIQATSIISKIHPCKLKQRGKSCAVVGWCKSGVIFLNFVDLFWINFRVTLSSVCSIQLLMLLQTVACYKPLCRDHMRSPASEKIWLGHSLMHGQSGGFSMLFSLPHPQPVPLNLPKSESLMLGGDSPYWQSPVSASIRSALAGWIPQCPGGRRKISYEPCIS